MCSAYAAPADVEAQSFKNLRQRISDNAEAQFWGSLLKHAVKLAPHVIGALGNGEAREAQDYDDDGDVEAQFWGSILKHAVKLAPHVIGALGNGEAREAQDYDDDGDVEAQFWGSLLRGAMKLAPHVVGAIGNGEAREAQDYDDDGDVEAQFWGSLLRGAMKLAPHVVGAIGNGEAREAQDYDDDGDVKAQFNFGKIFKSVVKNTKKYGPSVLDAINRANSGEGDSARIEAMLQNLDKAEVENFWKTLGTIGKTVGPIALGALGKK